MRGEVPTIRPIIAKPRGNDERFARTRGGPRPTLHHANRQSSIRNHQSEVVYEYDVYGQVAASDPNHPNRFMFTGREFDAETGLYYYRARYYNPTLGRFLQTDPIGYGDGMNWYAYCGNNSLIWMDPFGLAKVAFFDGADPGTPKTASGEDFAEAADDWLYFTASYDVSDAPGCVGEYILSILESWAGDPITDLYFYDHGNSYYQEIGDEQFGTDGSDFDFYEKIGQILRKWGTVIHLRGCAVGTGVADGSHPLLGAWALGTGCSVTGCEDEVVYTGPSVGPDYFFRAKVWIADPNMITKKVFYGTYYDPANMGSWEEIGGGNLIYTGSPQPY